MDLTLGPEQEAVRDAVRGVLADRQPMTRVRQVAIPEPPPTRPWARGRSH